MSTASRLVVTKFEDVYVVDFADTSLVDQLRIAQVNEELKKLAEKAGMPKLVIDFSRVTHVSSAMLGVLMSLQKNCVKAGGNVRLAGVNANLLQIFKLTKLDKIISIFPDADKACFKFK